MSRMLTEDEAAKRLRIGKTVLVTKILRLPDFPVLRLPGVRRVLIPEDELEAWIKNRAKGGGTQ